MKRLYYERSSFTSREAAWAHIEANWAESNPSIARKLDWEGVKTTYETAVYWEGRWHLVIEVIDYTERMPTPQGIKPVIDVCPRCSKPALVQAGDFFVAKVFVHLMGKKDGGKEVPLSQHFIQPIRPGAIFDASEF
jgi:hypothetical protein